MKISVKAAGCVFLFLGCLAESVGTDTINATNRFAYGANVGWIDAEGDRTNGAEIGRFYCSGYLWSANCGWICLGSGKPKNGYAYGNDAADDFGVNHDGAGHLEGYAYGADIGWIRFEQTYGKPRIDLISGRLSGYVWSANCGWISLSNAHACVQTDVLDDGPDEDADGIPDAWEFRQTGLLTVLASHHDADSDGASDAEEYGAGTDPLDSNDVLRITAFQVEGATNRITWPVKEGRRYTLMRTDSLTGTNGAWTAASESFIPSGSASFTALVPGVNATSRFYRVEAEPPLQ